ncbi:MAG TPA: hypothetical protein VGH77_23350 [Streptosporangiaceae bacterium]
MDAPAWPEVAGRLSRELGEPVRAAGPLTPRRLSRMTWAARSERAGPPHHALPRLSSSASSMRSTSSWV